MRRGESSRTLLFPGPQPPLSHLGATLLRQVVATALRFALHSLGAPMPGSPPVRMVRLRLYLDADKLEAALAGAPVAGELTAALVDPGGPAPSLGGAAALRGARWLHSLRLKLGGRRLPRQRLAARARASRSNAPRELWESFRARLSAVQPALNDAFLGELIASLDRRRARAAGSGPGPVLSREAHRLRAHRRADLGALGPPDLLTPSWRETPESAARACQEIGSDTLPRAGRSRGRFRETYRRALDDLRPLYLALAESAVAHALIDRPADAFFIPFDLADNLAFEAAPDWLAGAIASNRAEYAGLLQAGGPPDTLARGATGDPADEPSDWIRGPLEPLP